VTCQSAEDLPAFLESLPAAVGSHPYDLLVVDNAFIGRECRVG